LQTNNKIHFGVTTAADWAAWVCESLTRDLSQLN